MGAQPPPLWRCEGRDWPNRDRSRFETSGGLLWHVQDMGEGPVVLMLHGTGASTHSWRGLAPLLAKRFRVIAPDLPGHGFTTSRGSSDLTLPAMAAGVAGLLGRLGVTPEIVVGHSAGAAIALKMTLERLLSPRLIVAINGALKPYGGVAAQFFSPIARMLALNPFAPRFLAWRAEQPGAVACVIAGTGSRIDAEGLDFYRRLFSRPDHVSATVGMMAGWELEPLWDALPRIDAPVALIVGAEDAAVSPDEARQAKKRLPRATLTVIPDVGHLCHEERPAAVAHAIFAAAQAAGVCESDGDDARSHASES